jgi:hypothetical protein
VSVSAHSTGAYTATFVSHGNRLKGSGRAPPPSPARSDFSIMMGWQSPLCVCTLQYSVRSHLIKLKDDAAGAPYVTRLGPAQLQNDLRRAVVPRRHHARMVLPVEGGGPEVDEFDARVTHAPYVTLGGGAELGEPVLGHEEDVLRLEVRVRQVVLVQELKREDYR